MPGNFSIRICITTSEITDACIKTVEAVTTNTNSPGCLLICKMGILSTGTVRRIRFRHYGLSLIIQRCFSPECIIEREISKRFASPTCVCENFHNKLGKRFVPPSSYTRISEQGSFDPGGTFYRRVFPPRDFTFRKKDPLLYLSSVLRIVTRG